jgi:stage II sporulation protein M
VFISAGIFVLGFVAGLIFTLNSSIDAVDFFADDLAYLDDIGDLMEPGSFGTFLLILINNIIAFFFTLVLSPILLLLPILSLLVNGALISVVSVIVSRAESVGFVLTGLLPHGVIEIPAYIMAQAATLSFGFFILASIFSARRRARLGTDLKRSLKFFVIAVLLLIPAAIIETFITPMLLY